MSAPLTILCITKNEPHAFHFVADMSVMSGYLNATFLLFADGANAYHGLKDLGYTPFRVTSKGFIESVLTAAVVLCPNGYVLRLDDDERCSKGMIQWLKAREYEKGRHWRFPRAHLWRDEQHMLATEHLWPDHQTRLSLKEMSGDREMLHAGSPHGGGRTAPCAIEHHKFLVKSLEKRREMVKHYDRIQPGAGSNFRAFSCPEDSYPPDEIIGGVRPWNGDSVEQVAA